MKSTLSMEDILQLKTQGLSSVAVEAVAQEFDFDPEIINAIIQVESAGNPFATRFEPHYRYLWDCDNSRPYRKLAGSELNSPFAPDDFKALIGSDETEWVGQRISWGPMQVMGAVARELDFQGYFPMLCQELGVYYGTLHLSQLRRRFFDKHGIEGVVAAYNAGSPRQLQGKFVNQRYVDKVFAVKERLCS